MRFVVLLCLLLGAESHRVLMLMPVGGKSAKNLFYGLGEALSDRGHEVVFFNPFKPASPVKGIKEVVPEKLSEVMDYKNFPNMFEMKQSGMQSGLKQIYTLFVGGLRAAIESKELDQLLEEHFDIVIMGPYAYAFFSVPYLLKAPFTVLTPVSYMPFIPNVLGNPTLPAISPLRVNDATDQMTFIQRVKNVIGHLATIYVFDGFLRWYGDRLVTEKFGQGAVPPCADIERNMSFLLQSSNPVIHYHQALLPNVIEVGGLHCTEPKPLPKHLQDFLGDSEFIFFGLGSVAKPEHMPAELRSTLLQALGSLPYKVLLKWDTTDRTGIPPNILPSTWLPQLDILGSSRCRLFISHGGFASILESICHGVPMVTIPITGDHQFNAATAARLGLAVPLSWEQVTLTELTRAVQRALQPQVREAARHRRQLLQRQPVSARQLAVHWVEHAIRHRGAPHLRSIAAHLYWFQYYSLDVLAFLLAVLALLLMLLVKLLTCCCRRCCYRSRSRLHVHPEHVKRD